MLFLFLEDDGKEKEEDDRKEKKHDEHKEKGEYQKKERLFDQPGTSNALLRLSKICELWCSRCIMQNACKAGLNRFADVSGNKYVFPRVEQVTFHFLRLDVEFACF